MDLARQDCGDADLEMAARHQGIRGRRDTPQHPSRTGDRSVPEIAFAPPRNDANETGTVARSGVAPNRAATSTASRWPPSIA